MRLFSRNTNPSFDSLKASLIEKYGQPVDANLNSGYPVFLWSRNSQIRYSKRNLLSLSCSLALPDLGPLALGSYSRNGALANRDLPRCGSWLKVQVARASYNPALVSKIQIDAGDLSEIAASNAFLQNLLKSGAASAGADEYKRSQKAPL